MRSIETEGAAVGGKPLLLLVMAGPSGPGHP